MKLSSVEDRLLMNELDEESMRRSRNDSDSSESRFSKNFESESQIPRSSSVERFSMRANYDSSDFSCANSTSNERFHSDFSIALTSLYGRIVK